jgi:hypothetical protein
MDTAVVAACQFTGQDIPWLLAKWAVGSARHPAVDLTFQM